MSKCLPCKTIASDSKTRHSSNTAPQNSESSTKHPGSMQHIPINNNPQDEAHRLHNGDSSLMERKSNTFKAGDESPPKQRRNFTLPLSEVTNGEDTAILPPPKSSWLLRLFESKMFDMSIAVAYLFNSKETGVLTYLGNKLFVSITRSRFLQYDSMHFKAFFMCKDDPAKISSPL